MPIVAPWVLWLSKPFSSVPATRVPLLLVASDSRSDSAQILSERKKARADEGNGPGAVGGLVALSTGKSENPVFGSFGFHVCWLHERYSSSTPASLTL